MLVHVEHNKDEEYVDVTILGIGGSGKGMLRRIHPGEKFRHVRYGRLKRLRKGVHDIRTKEDTQQMAELAKSRTERAMKKGCCE